MVTSRVAVCVAGQLRSFMHPVVQRGFADRFHHEGYEYFLAVDEPVDRRRVLVSPVRAVMTARDLRNPYGACPRGTSMHRFLYPMAARIAQCHAALLEAEATGGRYHYVVRVRPDHAFLRSVPAASEWFARASRGRDLVLYDDQIALARRDRAEVVLLGPAMAYARCADPTRWAAACALDEDGRFDAVRIERDVLKDKAPCSPINLIATYFNATLRQCRSIRRVRREDCVLAPCNVDIMRLPDVVRHHNATPYLRNGCPS